MPTSVSPLHFGLQTEETGCCRKLVSSYPRLHFFEICVLANLAPGDAEEAKLMVPSLVVSTGLFVGQEAVLVPKFAPFMLCCRLELHVEPSQQLVC